MEKLDWKWYLSDLKQDKPVTVFSCFSCGGGSSMGYKRAGFKVLGNVEIDKGINEVYKKNNHPIFNFNMDLRDFNGLKELPDELYHLDILDGSPPCTTFSMAGDREESWGEEKHFREGAKKQTLDDLFFVFLDTVEKLRPRIVVAENVVGLVSGNARGYVKEILARFKKLGYEVQLFLLNSALMDVPQKRERVFFIANRCGFKPLKLAFNGTPIKFGGVRSEKGKLLNPDTMMAKRIQYATDRDLNMSKVMGRMYGRGSSLFGHVIVHDNMVAPTITAGGSCLRFCDRSQFSDEDYRNCQTFPQDYDFCGRSVQYVCGMSVPPNMMAHIAMEIWNQWLRK